MEYQIALSPDLGLSPADFVTAWNEEAEAGSVAEARLTPSTSTSYDPLLLGVVAVLGSIGTSVTANAIYDLIKKVLAKKGVPQAATPSTHIQIMEIKKPGGTDILVVDIEKK